MRTSALDFRRAVGARSVDGLVDELFVLLELSKSKMAV
jgi:hypothetical protein